MKIYSGTQAAYDAGIVSNNRSWSARLYYFYNNSWSNSLSASMLKSFSLSDYSTDGSNISMGCVLGGKLTVNLIKVPSSSMARLTDGTQIKIRLTLDSANVTLVSKAFVIDNKKLSKRLNGAYDVAITAYDVSYLMTHKYTTSLTEPTCLDIVGEIAAKYGLKVNSSVAEAVAAIDGATPRKYTPLADFTCKQTLGYMAGCYGCFAYINEDSEICFGWYTDSGNTIARNHVYEGSMYVSEMEERTIAMLESGTQSNPLVAPDSAGGFSINFENPYISQEQLTAIYNAKIADGAVSYRVGKVHYKGNPLNSPGKIITVSDIQSAKARFYIMKRTLRYDGGLSETIECQGESETTINYKINSPTQQRIDRALSRMEEAIKAATDAILQTQGSIFEFIPVDENDTSLGNAGFKLHYQDTGNSAFDDCVIMATAGGIGFSTNGGQSFDAAAMYFYQDPDTGEIYGCINGDFIRAGTISADRIDTTNLKVGTGNVDGLEDELDSLLADVETANSNASSAQSMANAAAITANSAYTNADTANSNASSALEKANSAINSTSALSTTQQKIIDICLTNDMTYINGASIATGSILADSIAANQITADKLSIGLSQRENLFYNPEFTKNFDDGETIYAEGWKSVESTLTPKDGWITIKPNDSYSRGGIYQTVWLKPGVYSIVAQMNIYNASSISSSAVIGYILGKVSNQDFFYDNVSLNIGNTAAENQNKEINVKYVVEYKGEEGFVDVGLFVAGMTFSGYVSMAWMALFNADEEIMGANFYSSDASWLKSDYKTSNLLTFESNPSSFIHSVNPFTVNNGGELDVISGNVGCLNFSRLQLSVESHVSDSIFGATFDGYLKISKPTGAFVFGSVSNYNDVIEASKAYAPSLDITDGENARSFVGIYGYNCTDGSYTSIVRPRKVETNGTMEALSFNNTSKEESKKDIVAKASALKAIKNSKIYEYGYKQDGKSAKRKTGFIIERETPEEIISDDGNGINLYSMASMNWKATQEILERLEAVEKAVKNYA